MNKAKKEKMAFFFLVVTAIVTELAAVFMIAKAIATDSSPDHGLIYLNLGLIWLMIAMTRKPKNGKTDAS